MFVRRASTIVSMAAMLGLGLSSAAHAGTGHPNGPLTSAKATTATCEWVVVWSSAGVYEKPTRANPPLKVKHSGDHVGGGFCLQQYNSSEAEWYVSVTCSCAADGIGWMRLNALRPA